MEKLSESILNEFINLNTIRHQEAMPPREACFLFPKGEDLIVNDNNNQKER